MVDARLSVLCLCILASATAFLSAPPSIHPHHARSRLSQTAPPTTAMRCNLIRPATSHYRGLEATSDAPRRGTNLYMDQMGVARLPLPGTPLQVFSPSSRTGHEEGNSEQFNSNPTTTGCLRRRRPAAGAGRIALTAASALAVALAVAAFAPGPALAAAAKASDYVNGGLVDPSEHLHVGQKIAKFFRRGGLPDWATLMTISAMPVVELRGGVPVGMWMGMPIVKTFALCVAGNMIPIPVILLALRSQFVQKLAKPVLDRAREKAEGFGDEKSQALALTLFVGIPLPGTGAWTGAMGAFLLGMPFGKAMLSIFLGVISAGLIMSCLTLAGKAGALLATSVLAVFCVSSILSRSKTKASDNASS